MLLAAAARVAMADEAPLLSEGVFLDDVPTVLTASRLVQSVADVPVTMTEIDRATIEASGLRSLADLMRLVPGMYVGHANGVEGVVPVVSYHGMTNEASHRMQVLIDGRSVYTPLFGTVLWDDLPISIDDVERIEVSRGPNAASYGANAFFGTINIITRTPLRGDGAGALVRGGGRGEREAQVSDSGGAGTVTYRATAGHKSDDGFVNVFDSQHHNFLTARADVAASPRDVVQVQAGFSEGDRAHGFATSAIDRPRVRNVQDEYLQGKWQRSASPDDELSLQYYFERYAVSETDQTLPLRVPGMPLQPYFFQGSYDTVRQDIELQRTVDIDRSLRLVAGGSLRRDEIDAPIYFDGHPQQATSLERLFAHAEWRASATVLLQAGGMLEHTSIAGTSLSPRASITWHLDPAQSLRASISRATRTPLAYEDHANYGLDFGPFRDQIDLATGTRIPEQMTSTEVGYHAIFPAHAGQFDLKLYHDRGANLIVGIATPSAQSIRGFIGDFRNRDEIHVSGAEAELHYVAPTGTLLNLTYAHTVLSSNNNPFLDGTMPRNLFSVLAGQRLGASWSASAALYQSGPLEPQGGLGAIGAARRLDLRVTRELEIRGHRAKLSVGAENLLSGYPDFEPDNIFTRRYYVEFSASL